MIWVLFRFCMGRFERWKHLGVLLIHVDLHPEGRSKSVGSEQRPDLTALHGRSENTPFWTKISSGGPKKYRPPLKCWPF